MEEGAKNHIDKKIGIKLWIYWIVFFVSLVLSAVHYVNGHISFYFPLGGFITGFVIGRLVSRTHKVGWNEDRKMIDLKLDAFGAVILLLYILFVIFKNVIIEDIVHFHHISSISMAVLSGTMLGHALALRIKIKKVLDVFFNT